MPKHTEASKPIKGVIVDKGRFDELLGDF